jgi:hypothetical protein
MNERIKQLMQGCFDVTVDHRGREECCADYINVQKFAELIVRECANQCDLLLDHRISSEWSRGTHDCSRAIKKHFGVEP